MAMDTILAQAFGNVNAPSQNFAQGLNQGTQIASQIMDANIKLEGQRQTMLQHQQQLQQKYVEKAADLLKSAGDEKTPGPVRKAQVQSASKMSQLGGFGAFSDDFMRMFNDSPDLRQSWVSVQQQYQDSLANPTDQAKSQALGETIKSIMNSSYEDMPSVMRKLDDANKNYATVLGRGMQGKIEQGATLDRFKKTMEDLQSVSKLQSSPGALRKPLLDASGNPVTGSDGQPMTLGQAMQRLVPVQSGQKAPTTEDNQLLFHAQNQAGKLLSQEEQYKQKVDAIKEAKKSLAQTPLSQASKELKDSAKYLLSNQPTSDNVDRMYDMAQLVQNRAVTNKDVTERNRNLDDRATTIKTEYITKVGTANKGSNELLTKVAALKEYFSRPGITAAEATIKLGDLAQTVDGQQRATDEDAQRMMGLTKYQQGLGKIQSIFNQSAGAPLIPDQVNAIRNALDSMTRSTKMGKVLFAYDNLKQVNALGGDISPRMKELKGYLQNEVGKFTVTPRAALVDQVYDKAAADMTKISAGASTEEKINRAIEMLLSGGYNPVAAERMIRMRAKAKGK